MIHRDCQRSSTIVATKLWETFYVSVQSNMTSDINNYYKIQCSMFVCAIVNAITYRNYSRCHFTKTK